MNDGLFGEDVPTRKPKKLTKKQAAELPPAPKSKVIPEDADDAELRRAASLFRILGLKKGT